MNSSKQDEKLKGHRPTATLELRTKGRLFKTVLKLLQIQCFTVIVENNSALSDTMDRMDEGISSSLFMMKIITRS